MTSYENNLKNNQEFSSKLLLEQMGIPISVVPVFELGIKQLASKQPVYGEARWLII